MIVRARTLEDLPACVAALRAVHDVDGYPTYWPQDAARWLTPDGCAAAWVAFDDDGTALGHVCVVQGVDDAVAAAAAGVAVQRLAGVSRLFVAPAARGRGLRLGTALLTEAEGWSRRRALQLMLDVVDDGAPAVQLYERLG
ncbi:GNAT family N-acetyltransferase [Kineococcus gypseus]|uniref:GNAT family N-acetyltransferase n=1 Tax=Kineococcus gypseus TaxID=1637102 RepID=UPI003D7DE56F